MSNGQPTTQYYTQGVPPQTRPVLQAANTSYQSTVPKGNARKIPGAKFFAIFTVIIAILLSTLGIVAIIIEAKDSYVGDPIWTAVLFILPAGALGLLSYLKRNSMCSNVSYLIMNIFACLMSAHLVFYASINAVRERSWWYSDYVCNPWPGFDFPDYPDYNPWSTFYDYNQTQWYIHGQITHDQSNCQFPSAARIAVDSLIAVLAFTQFVLSVISLAFTCYGACTCCHNCCRVCRPSPPPAVIQYTAQNGSCQLMSIGAYQTPIPNQPVSLMVPAGQPGQVISPNFTVVPGQYQSQPVFMPASPNQEALIQQPQPIVATPGSFVSQPKAATPGSFVSQPMAATPGSFINQPMAATPGSFINQQMASSPGSFVVSQPAPTAPTPMATTLGFVVNPPMAATSGSFINQPMASSPGSVVVNQPPPTAPTPMAATTGFVVNPSMVATPDSFVNQPALTAPTSNGGMANASTASTDTKPETSAPLQEPSNVAYGQMSSEQFHDKRNLLD